MAHESFSGNPFMMLTHPEVVLAAVERSERLSQLNLHLCRPLDRQMPAIPATSGPDASLLLDESDDDAADAPA